MNFIDTRLPRFIATGNRKKRILLLGKIMRDIYNCDYSVTAAINQEFLRRNSRFLNRSSIAIAVFPALLSELFQFFFCFRYFDIFEEQLVIVAFINICRVGRQFSVYRQGTHCPVIYCRARNTQYFGDCTVGHAFLPIFQNSQQLLSVFDGLLQGYSGFFLSRDTCSAYAAKPIRGGRLP